MTEDIPYERQQEAPIACSTRLIIRDHLGILIELHGLGRTPEESASLYNHALNSIGQIPQFQRFDSKNPLSQ